MTQLLERWAAPALAAALAAAMFTLAGCGGSLFQSKIPPAAVYQLSAQYEAAQSAQDKGPALPVDLSVLRPRVRTGLDNDLIAALYPDRRLDYLADARWSGPLDELMQDLALQAFRARANLRIVHAEESPVGGGYWLAIDVNDFQAEYTEGVEAPTAHVHLLAGVGAAGDERILARFEADARRPAAANRVTAIVEAYNQAADEALAQIVADTVAALERR